MQTVSDLSKATKLGNGREGFEPPSAGPNASATPMYLYLAGAFLGTLNCSGPLS